MSDIFDIDLNELANLEGDIITPEQLANGGKTPVETVKAVKKDTKEDNKEDNEAVQSKSLLEEWGMTEEELANLDSEDTDNKDNKDTKTPVTSKNNTQDNSSSSQYSSLAKVLFDAGVLSLEDEEKLAEITDVDALVESVKETIKKNEYADLTQDQKEYLDALKSGVPSDVYKQKKADATIYKNISDEKIEDESAVNLRAQLIMNSFLAKGMTETEARKLTKRSLDSGEDVEDAKEAKAFLVAHSEKSIKDEIEKAQRAAKEKAESDAEKLKNLKSNIDKKNEIIPGISFNAQTKEKIYNSITAPVGEIEGKPVNDFMKRYLTDEDFKVAIHYMDLMTKGFTDLSKLKTTEKSKAVKELEQTLKTTQTTAGKSFAAKYNTGGSTARAIVDALP